MVPKRISLVLLLLAAMLAPRALAAQDRPTPLEGFVANVARLWARGDAAGLVSLAPADGRIVLDLGREGSGSVEGRHVAAALRELFGGRETVSARPTSVTIAGGEPLSGFGQLAWVSRSRGVTDARTATVYVGAVWEHGGWRIRELRIL
ncbi:MAG TPA: hypothetical protein VFQ39_09135 [Longimicrobium sp.]|nr:hypothetical protein [Longimicrobium sp.]